MDGSERANNRSSWLSERFDSFLTPLTPYHIHLKVTVAGIVVVYGFSQSVVASLTVGLVFGGLVAVDIKMDSLAD